MIKSSDPEISALLSGGLLLRKNIGTSGDPNHKSIGWAAPGVGDDPAGNGVAIEAWSHAVKDGKRSAVLPYFHWVFPYAKMRQSGDRVIENGMLATTFEGYGLGNVNFKSGIDGRWEFPVAAERPYAYARADWAPTGLTGFYTWTDNATDEVYFTKAGVLNASTVNIVSSEAWVANTTAQLVFSAAHNLQVNDTIFVKNIGTAFDGTVTVASANTTHVTYTSSAITANVASANVASTARIQVVNSTTESHPAPIAVTSTALGVGGTTYNVPGSVDYNADNAIDNIIAANEIG